MEENVDSFKLLCGNSEETFMTEVETLAKNHNWNMPTKCSVCGTDLVINANHKEIKCSNELCKSRYMGRISKWTDTLKIKEFGLTTIEKMIDNNIFKTIPDLYKIDYTKIASMDGFGEKSAAKMKSELDSHKEATLAEFIAGFNITDCGENIIQNVIDGKGFNTLDAFLNAKANDFIMDGLKEKTADKLYNGLQALKEDMLETVKFVKIKEIKKVEGGSLGGQSFCFTGPAQRKRSELWEIVEKNGGVVHESCKKDTNFLVMADKNSTSSKAEKARKNGTTMLSEEEFIGMCEVL